jgi:hypothetical protein
MMTMIDEIYDRHYREARADLNAALTHALSRLGNAIHDAFDERTGAEAISHGESPAGFGCRRRGGL